MKKLITLLLVLTGMVTTASATASLYVNKDDNVSWWVTLRVYAWGDGDGNNNGWNNKNAGIVTSTVTRFGKTWYKYDLPDGFHSAVVQQGSIVGETFKVYNKTANITGLGTKDKYVIISNGTSGDTYKNDNNEDKKPYNYAYHEAPVYRGNGTIGWSTTTSNMTVVDDNTLTIDLYKDYVDAISDGDIRFRIYNFGNQLYPNTSGKKVVIAGSGVTEITNGSSDNYFSIDKPAYTYDHITVTAAYNTSTSKWTVSADAYIAKEVGTNLVATFGSGADVDFTGIDGLTAQKLKVNTTNGTLIATSATTLKAGEGAYLTATTAKTYYIPVAASASADTDHNDLKAITSTSEIDQTDGAGNTRYILSIVNAKVGFYKVNKNGSWCGAGTAYLETPYTTVAGAREYFWLDDETTGIEAVDVTPETVKEGAREYYNLNGQRVMNPSKGLYIVNGKKVIIK